MYDKILKTGLLLLMTTMGGSSALAETSTWDGTTKYTTLSDAGITGDGTEVSPYLITNANQFVAFGTLPNSSDTKYWKLTVDIDLDGHEWPYSGNTAKTFKGHFDGQNHIVKNYTITPVTNKANGLFGTVQGSSATNRAEIKNLKLDDVTITTDVTLGSTTYIGALVGNSNQYVDFENIQIVNDNSNSKTVTITLDNINGNCHIGGLIGQYQKNSTMKNCTVNMPVINIQGAGTVGGGSNIGGVIGNFTGASGAITSITDQTPSDVNTTGLTVNNPSVTINKIASTWYIGSVFGRINNYSDVNYVTVANPTLTYNAVGSPNNDLYLGTLAGHIQGNAGNATTTPVSTPVKNINITGTSNLTIGTGSEEIKKVKAGVVGYALNNVDINEWNIATSNITVNGSLTTSTDYFGGVIGHVTSNQSAASTDTQTAVDGVTLGSSTITVTGNVVKESYIGSIFGRIEGHNGNASNKPKRTVVKDITTTGITKVVFGTNVNPVSVANVRAGAIGFLGVNSELTHSNIYDTRIELNGTLDTGSSYLGGVVAHVQSSNTAFAGVAENGIATKVDDLTVTSSTVTVTGNVNGSSGKELYIGSAFGRLEGNVGSATVAPQHVLASNITAGTMALTFGTNSKTVDVAAVKAGLVGHALNYATVRDWNITTSNVTLNGTIATTGGYLGGVIGQVSSAQSVVSGTDFTNISTVALGSSTVTVTGNITKDSHIGSLFGRVEGTAGNATNYPKRTTVTGVTTSGITKVVFGSNSNNVNVAGVRAGAIGSAAANAKIYGCTLADTQIELNGNFITSTGYLGGIVGQVQSSTTAFPGILQDAIGTKIDDITVKNSNVNVTGNVGVQLFAGGGFGRFEGATSTTVAWQATQITNIKFKNDGNTGMSSVTIGTNNSNTINYVRAGVAGMAYQNAIIDEWDIEKASVVVNGKLQTTSSYVGGCIGHVQSINNGPVTMSDMQITVSDVVAINGDIEKDTYIGGAFGRMDQNKGDNNKAPTAENVKITGLNMSFGGDFKLHVYAGGIVGYLAAVNHTVTNLSSVVNCSASGQIRSTASKTFVQDRTYAFGGIVGYNNQNATTNRSEIKQCVSEVDINLGGYTPSTLAAGLSNLYKNGFAVGGVIGRLDNPSLLPEHLYYSGKIYAPFAVVGPIIGTFQKSLASSATYIYEDYSGEYAAPTLSAAEWEKEKSWYYYNYQLGLSSAVIDQTARSKNYTAATTNVGGVEYLTVTDNTFQEVNVINSGKLSKTVLRYIANNKNVDLGIFPNWTTNSVTYPEYYMYYMQGVNRGVYMDNVAFAKELIKNEVSILPNMVTTQAGGSYTFTTSLGEVESKDGFTITYQWLKKDEVTPTGDTTKEITLTDDQLTTYGGTVYCVITVNGPNTTSKTYTLRGSNAYVVFVNGASGTDNTGGSTTRGWTPETAVKTLNHANSLLRTTANGGSVDTNIIVVMGTLNSDADFRSDGKNPATITGRYDGKDYAGIIKIKQINLDGGENVVNTINPETGTKGSNCYVQADTKFEYLTFQANSTSDGNNFIELHGNDVTFGKGLSMTNFRNLTKNHGNLDAAQNIPELTIVLTATNLNEATIQRYTDRTKPQVVTFESGRYGRIMGGRYTNGFFAKSENTSHTILGSAEHPVWAVVNVDIDKNNPNVGTINRSEAPSTGTVTNSFTCDINCIIAGLTDGSMYGDYQINVHGGKVGYIVGGNQGNPVPNGSKTFTQPGGKSGNWGQWPNATYFGRTVINVEQDDDLKDIVIDNLYAGGLGREANGESATSIVDMYMYGHTEINMMSGTVNGNIYGGGAGGVIGLNPWDMHVPYATTEGDNATNAIMNGVQYGEWGAKKSGDALASVTLHNLNNDGITYTAVPLNLGTSSTTLNISGGTINGSVYGGGCGYVSNMPKEVCMQGVGSVFGTSNVNVTGGTINGSVYGGSEGSDKYYGATNKYNQKITNIAEMNGTVNLTISGNSTTYPTINGNVYGAGKGITSTKTEEYLRIATTGNADLGNTYKSTVNITVDLPDNVEFPFDIYGGGEMGKVDCDDITITLKGGKLTGNVYGGGLGEAAHIEKAKVIGNTTITMQAGDPARTLSIGKNEAARNIYGGGNLAQLEGNTTLNLNHGSIVGNVYGGGKGLSKAESGSVTGYGKVTGNSTITMNNTTVDTSISGDIFGGGALGELTGNTTFTINNGTVGGYVYGGGALADVGGNTTVNLFGGSVAGAYGGGLGSNDVAAIVGGDATVTLGKKVDDGNDLFHYEAAKVTGAGLFGGNNLNGTPKGHVFVHVLKTTTRGQANRNATGTVANFDVAAVYGGGNQAAYEPNLDPAKGGNANQFAEVLIENCDNSIAYVYGGGNAAPVPATNVKIYGADAIDNAFAGGNGEGVGNLGADIGYLAYTRDDTHKYGLGTASINVYGGTVRNVYGGSNTLGYIRSGTTVSVGDKPVGDTHNSCERHVSNTFGGGNKADITSNITINCNCGNDAKVLYGGANQANVLGDVTINIHSGAFEQVFCGNNQSGVIKGKLTVNVDETDCSPVMIGELYGCGNNAPYSVYGYDSNNVPRTSLTGLTQGQILEERLPYGDPEINVISCTRIGRIFGGGFSSRATVYGNTHVTINTIPGRHNGTSLIPDYYVDEDTYEWIDNKTAKKEITIPEGVGIIGNVYGGGNEADVVGNTYVNILTTQTNRHMVTSEWTDDAPYNTSVIIEGDVFGGSKGSEKDPDAGQITGTTNVNIGYE